MKAQMFDRMTATVAVISVAICMFVPLLTLSIALRESRPITAKPEGTGEAEVTVGIAVIIRATARRLLRTGAQNVLRTTFGAFTRTTVRTFTRRFIRMSLKPIALSVTRGIRHPGGAEAAQPPQGSSWLAVLLGYVGLTFSFWGVLLIVRHESPQTVSSIVGGIPPIAASLLAAFPILVYSLLTQLYARWFRVRLHFQTQLDGLLLQAYFTGAGSFLPLTTDVDYRGSSRNKTRVATLTLMSMLILHLVLHWLGWLWNWEIMRFCGATFLVYCFVYAFPLRPLEGHYIWTRSKLLWFFVWAPILVLFVMDMPEAFTEIL
jgi:hypothetical protein